MSNDDDDDDDDDADDDDDDDSETITSIIHYYNLTHNHNRIITREPTGKKAKKVLRNLGQSRPLASRPTYATRESLNFSKGPFTGTPYIIKTMVNHGKKKHRFSGFDAFDVQAVAVAVVWPLWRSSWLFARRGSGDSPSQEISHECHGWDPICGANDSCVSLDDWLSMDAQFLQSQGQSWVGLRGLRTFAEALVVSGLRWHSTFSKLLFQSFEEISNRHLRQFGIASYYLRRLL